MSKLFFFLQIMIGFCQLIYCQVSNNIPEIIPPSPTAASLGKFGEYPVSYSNGTISISVPFYSFELSKGLTLHVSLDYHSSGMKVEDYGSWAGTGWALTAGGCISREIRSIADEAPNGFYNYSKDHPGHTFPYPIDINNAQHYQFLQKIEIGAIDPEPDIFSYNINGRSGRFFVDNYANVRYIPYCNIKVVRHPLANGTTNQEWELVDENGIHYVFAEGNSGIESTEIGTKSLPTAWYLRRVISPEGTTLALFDYSDATESYTTVQHRSERFEMQVSSSGIPENTKRNYLGEQVIEGSTYEFMGKGRLNRITIPGKGYVTIEANTNRTDIVGKLLSKIQVWNSAGTLITEYNFTYNLNNQRHYLTKITQKVDNRYINYREFSYYPGLPAQNSKSQDLWGYYNGAVNSNLFPYTVGFNDGLTLKFTGFANRNPSTNAVAGTINMIKYPTGGYTKFEFENNRAKTSTGNITQQTGNLNQTVVGQKESQPFNVITEILKATITFSIHPMGYYLPEISLWNTDNIQLIKRWGYDNLPSNCTPVQNSDGSQKYSFTEQINLSQGNYKWIIKILKDDYVPPGIQIQPASVNYTYFTQSEPSANGELCGGIRIKTISNYDNGDVLLNQTKYSYLTSQGICSGIMTPKPEFVKQMCIGIPLSPVLAAYLFVREIFETNLNRYNGVPVEYSEVTEEQTDATNNIQRTVYNYSTAGLWRQSYIIAEQYDPFSATFIPYSLNDYGRGLLLKKTDYKLTNGVFTAVKEENNDFNIVETNVPRFRAIAFRKYLNPEGPNSNLRLKYQYGNYDIVSGKVYLTKNTIKETADNGGTIITVTNYEYGNSEFVQPTRVTQEDSRNKSLQTIYSYCYDLPDNIYVAMKNANIIKTPIIITKKTDNAQTEQVKNNFSFFTENGIIKLASVTRKIKTGEEYTEVIIDNYDKKGNILQFHKPGETNTLDISYIWGYDSTYAIAEVKNAKYSDVFHTSFEDSDGVNDAFSKTGSKTRKTNYSKTISGISNGAYILSFWKRTGAVWTMQTTQVNVSNRQYTISLAATTTNPIDEVRFYPSGALMNTYTYDPLIGITSETDPNGRTIYYEYDGFGRLRYIRDNEKNIIQEYKYHYKE